MLLKLKTAGKRIKNSESIRISNGNRQQPSLTRNPPSSSITKSQICMKKTRKQSAHSNKILRIPQKSLSKYCRQRRIITFSSSSPQISLLSLFNLQTKRFFCDEVLWTLVDDLRSDLAVELWEIRAES
jgi:hypothetical protein